jgi:hypothetical protein
MMSVWHDLVQGFTNGFLAAAARQGQAVPYRNGAGPARGRIDQLCRELGWSVDEREGSVVHLHFNDPAHGIRKVRIADGDDCVVTFSAHSFAVIPPRKVTGEMLAYLLRRNISGSGLGMWGMYVDERHNVWFNLLYQALGDGLDAEAFKYICQSLATEAADFDGKMREEGLLK